MLVDSRNNQPFYIGKGKGKRYQAHVIEALNDETNDKEKIKRINEILAAGAKVDHYIVRWDLSEIEALKVEASLIDFCKFCNQNNVCPSFTNIQGGHDGDFGIMPVDGVLRFEDNNLPAFDVKKDHCILIKLKDNDFKTKDIYDRARLAWKIGKDVIKDAHYVLVCHNNRITDIFKVTRWYRVKSVGKDQWEECNNEEAQKYGFEGDNITCLDGGQLTPVDRDIISRFHNRIFKGATGNANPYQNRYTPKKE